MNGPTIICFSKDRPLQLDGYIRSVNMAFGGASGYNLHVIYSVSTPEMNDAYNLLILTGLPATFHKEANLKRQVRDLAESASQYVMFGCDDVIFTNYIHNEYVDVLKNDVVFGFSFRLGTNVTYCHPADRRQVFPGKEIDKKGIYAWAWPNNPGGPDYSYPFELNATVYRKETVLRYLDKIEGLDSWHPNIFEGNFYRWEIMSDFALKNPVMCSYETSRAYTITVNRVQEVAQNRIYESVSADELLKLYNEGMTIDLDYYRDKVYPSVHIGDLKLRKA